MNYGPRKTGNVDNPTKNGIYCMNIGRLLESNGELSSEWKVQRWYCIESSKRAKNRHQFYFDEKKKLVDLVAWRQFIWPKITKINDNLQLRMKKERGASVRPYSSFCLFSNQIFLLVSLDYDDDTVNKTLRFVDFKSFFSASN